MTRALAKNFPLAGTVQRVAALEGLVLPRLGDCLKPERAASLARLAGPVLVYDHAACSDRFAHVTGIDICKIDVDAATGIEFHFYLAAQNLRSMLLRGYLLHLGG